MPTRRCSVRGEEIRDLSELFKTKNKREREGLKVEHSMVVPGKRKLEIVIDRVSMVTKGTFEYRRF